MRNLHTQLMEDIFAEQNRLTSRRRLLSGSVKLAGGGALALAVSGVPLLPGVAPARA